MSQDGSITLAWGDGEYRFRLGIGELRELEAKRDAGAHEIFGRLTTGTWRIDDVIQTLRIALIGGGLDPNRALAKTGRFIMPGTFFENRVIASAILKEALYGDESDLVGKLPAALRATLRAFDGRESSETAPQWDGPSPPSMPAHSGNSPPRSTDGTPVTAPENSGSRR